VTEYAHAELPVEKVVKSAKRTLNKCLRVVATIGAFIDVPSSELLIVPDLDVSFSA
jgi:hypothetical protein